MEIKITETVLRDGQQSLIATRMSSSDFEPVLENLDNAGFYSIECWGGATFDACLRYLKEDPWERLRKIKAKMKKTKLQMLLRGQNLLGYKHYPDDVVRKFVQLSIKNGIDILRIFDALNDYRNIEVAVDETLKCGGHAQGTIVYTTSPIHDLKTYVKLGKELEAMGVSSICIKDMAGIMGPQEAKDLIGALKEAISKPIFIHTHSTTGLAPMTYLKAIEAGCDGIDTAISSFSGGTSQPATESMNYALKKMGYVTGVKEESLKEINDFFKKIKEKFVETGILDSFVLGTETDALIYQIPGGMLSNLITQLKQQNALDKLEQVLEETPRVRKDLGYPPLVTPMSQMVGVQAVANILSGERYKNISKEVKSYIRGEYGRTPGEMNPKLIAKVLGDEKRFTGRFADTLSPQFDKVRNEIKDIAKTEEEVLSYILFPQITEKFFKEREESSRKRVKYTIMKA